MANFKSAILTTGSITSANTADPGQEYIAAVDVSNEDRISFQFYNPNGTPSNTNTVRVYGRLGTPSGTLASAAEWTQIGDNVVVSGGASSLKSIATTGLNWVGVTCTTTVADETHTYSMLRQA